MKVGKITSYVRVKAISDEQQLRLTDRKRASIVQAAVEEFRSRGYGAASMNRIAELAEVSKRTLYRHFDGKEALFEAITEQIMVLVENTQYAEFDPEVDLAKQLSAIAKTEMQLISSEPIQALARAGLSRVIGEPDAARSIDHDRFIERLIEWLKDAKSAGHFRKMRDFEFAALQFSGLLQAFAFWPPIVRGEEAVTARSINKIAKESVRMFMARYEADE